MADRVTVELTQAELKVLQDLRAGHAIPEAVGQPMPYDESARQWGEAPPPNPASVQRLPTKEQWVAKQLRNLQAVGEQNYREGITRPRKDPIQAGIDAQPAYENAMSRPEVRARRVTGLQKTNMAEWAAMSENVGAARLVAGVVDRRHKVERAVGELQVKLAAHLSRIDAMPNATDSDRERRMVENLKGLRAMKGA